MKKNDIRNLEITKKMYNRAKEVEDMHKKIRSLDCRTEEFRKLINKVVKLENKFEEEISDEFDTLEIVNEYKRRMKYEYLLIKKNKEGLVYEKTFFNNSAEARKDFRKGDILLKCKYHSIYYGDNFNDWSVKEEDIIKKYYK